MITTKHTRTLLGAISALGLSGLYAPAVYGATYNLVPGDGSTLTWGTASTWNLGAGAPGDAAGDIANVSGDYSGKSQTVNLAAALTSPLTTTLTLGDTNAAPQATTISASTGIGLGLNGAAINSAGAAGAVNTISAPILLTANSNLYFGISSSSTVAANNPLTISGKISPATVGATRTIENNSGQTVTLGDIDLNAGGGTGVVVTIRNSNSTANNKLVLSGTIADGAGQAASALTIGSRSATGVIQIDGNNTYTGNTVVGVQGIASVYLINSNQPFGPAANGSLALGGPSNNVNILEAINGDRNITKNTTSLTRNVTFQGSNSIAVDGTTITYTNTPVVTNNITTANKVATLGVANGNIYLNNNPTDFGKVRAFAGAGTTVIASNISDNSGTVNADSRMVVQMNATGTVVLTGTNKMQGGTRITSTGTLQLGNGGTSGSIEPGNSVTPVVNGTAAGKLAFNRSDAVSTPLTANGQIGITQKGSGAVTLTNSQFHSGANSIGDGVTASKLVVNGAAIAASSTTSAATIASTTLGATLTVNSITLTGTDVTTNLRVGQPVYLTSAGATASTTLYIDSIQDSTHFRAFGTNLLGAGSFALTFGSGSALGTSAATTTVNNLGTLAGTGAIAGSVIASTGSFLAPGATDGAAGTLSVGSLSLDNGATLDFDLAATAAGTSDFISATGSVNFSALNFKFSAITAGVLETGVAYNLVSGAAFAGDASQIATTFTGGLTGYTANYSVGGTTPTLSVTFSAVPEPSSFAAFAGLAALAGGLGRRRRRA